MTQHPSNTGSALRPLSALQTGERAVISCLDAPAETSDWLMEAGFLPCAPIEFLYAAPGGSPRIYIVDGTEIAIRKELADTIRIGCLR